MNTENKIKKLQYEVKYCKKQIKKLNEQIINLQEHILTYVVQNPKKYKLTLTQFWNCEKELAIHCNTEEKANRLLKAFDRLGKKWSSGDSYLDDDYYHVNMQDTCYTNISMYCDKEYLEKSGCRVYEFEDIDLDN